MKKLIFIASMLLSVIAVRGQEFSGFEPDQFSKDTNYGSFNYVHLMYFKGDHLTYPNGFEEAFTKGYNAFELRVGWQSTGRQAWQQIHDYPVYGLGVFASSLGEADVDSLIGSPSALYFFYGAPLLRAGKFTMFFDLAIGLSYDFNPYDSDVNPTNDVIGSRVNLYFNGNMIFMYQVSERVDLTLGANFFHFSNGRTNTPQRGINLAGLNIGAKYNFNAIKSYTKHSRPEYQPQIRPTFAQKSIPPVNRYGELQFTTAFGTVETEPGEMKGPDGFRDTTNAQKRYYTSTISGEYAYKVFHRLKLHTGLNAMYDGSLENFLDDTPPQDVDFDGKFMFGYHFGFQYLIERFAFYYSYGRYLYKETSSRGNWYMRAGGRIGITENFDAHIALKTRNGGIADWIEWGVAYKFKIHD